MPRNINSAASAALKRGVPVNASAIPAQAVTRSPSCSRSRGGLKRQGRTRVCSRVRAASGPRRAGRRGSPP
eukprot:CAMPEP_0175684294 /NCGR_PEP_ID=MMETSP0097-20121207/26765_1 /TAXON_ID=311494 /ORGANISM="Alexandrium monilatum, Strain CCMP3105" /LENGTH=70 /DNA_ID=CAMNT_0016991223 /DNA_START=1 /DNA_END=210 /DNA_ORIENTATION=-